MLSYLGRFLCDRCVIKIQSVKKKRCDTRLTFSGYSVCVKRITLCNCLCSSSVSSCFVWQPCTGLRNSQSVFLILKFPQYCKSRRQVQFIPSYSCKNLYKNWYFHFHRSCDHHIWRWGTSWGVDANETNQAGAEEVITSRSQLHLYYPSSYGHQTFTRLWLSLMGF